MYVWKHAENLPIFALPDDSVVEIQGEATGVHKAVELVATHLRKFLVDRSVIGIFEMQVSCSLVITMESAIPFHSFNFVLSF